jgi:hypothetical protein
MAGFGADRTGWVIVLSVARQSIAEKYLAGIRTSQRPKAGKYHDEGLRVVRILREVSLHCTG